MNEKENQGKKSGNLLPVMLICALVNGFLLGYLTNYFNVWLVAAASVLTITYVYFFINVKKFGEEIKETAPQTVKGGSSPWIFATVLLALLFVGSIFVDINWSGDKNTTGSAVGSVKDNSANNNNQAVPTNDTAPAKEAAATPSVDDDPVLGNADAPVTIIEFSDFQCPYCSRHFNQTYPQIVKNFVDTGKVKIVFRDFPLSFHQNAMVAATAANCANEQNKYWEMHDKLFVAQDEWANSSNPKDNFTNYAKQLGLNENEFSTCTASDKYASEIQKDLTDGQAAGVSGTPAFFVNNQFLEGAMPYASFETAINQELN